MLRNFLDQVCLVLSRFFCIELFTNCHKFKISTYISFKKFGVINFEKVKTLFQHSMQLQEAFFFRMLYVFGLCVCVCVCVCERERGVHMKPGIKGITMYWPPYGFQQLLFHIFQRQIELAWLFLGLNFSCYHQQQVCLKLLVFVVPIFYSILLYNLFY